MGAGTVLSPGRKPDLNAPVLSREDNVVLDAGNNINGLRAEDLNPHIAFHYGIPSGSSSMAYDSTQQILAIATNDGRIKLFGRENTQALLQSDEAVPSKFLQVWDVDVQQLCHIYMFNEEITSFSIIQRSLYMYVGTSIGDISILKLDQRERKLLRMQYRIPFMESYGNVIESGDQIPIAHILPQPMAETRSRVLIVFRDGLLSLWGIQESKTLFTCGSVALSSNYESRAVMSACWTCTFGSKVAIGYSNGDLFLWAIPVISEKHGTMLNKKEIHAAPNIPFLKLNLGYKMDKIPITSLRWVVSDGKASHLYINGFSELGNSSFQVIILNDNSESRTIKLSLPLTEPCLGMEIISSYNDGNKQKKDSLVLLLKSGHLCLYSDSEIENSLLKCQSKSTPSLPNHTIVKLPYYESRITASKLYGGFLSSSGPTEEDNLFLANKFSHFLSADKRENLVHVSTRFEGFAKTRRLYITGHMDGAINFWDASFPVLLLMLTIKPQQSEEGNASSNSSVTALHFDFLSQILICGDQSGLVRIISFKKEQLSSDNMFSFLQAKLGANYIIQTIKLKGTILSLGVNTESKHVAVGTDKGYVYVFDIKGASILYQKQFPTQIYTGTISLQFENCNHNGYIKNVLLIATEDSSVIAVEADTGNDLSSNGIHTKKPSRCLLMQILDISPDGVCTAHLQELNQGKVDKDKTINQSLILLCSEKAVRLYSLNHAVQGIKKLHCKKKLSGPCCFTSVISSHSSEIGLAILFASGKLEIRSLPDLTLLKEMTVRGFINSAMKSYPNSNGAICCSSEGELLMANGDQEMIFFSILMQKAVNRSLESISKVYKRGVIMQQESFPNLNAHKEKKNKGIFSMVVKGSKSKHNEETVPEVSCSNSIEDLSNIFSTANFESTDEITNTSAKNEEIDELDINDIDLDDTKDKPKGLNFPALNKQSLGKKLQEIRGILKPKSEEKLNATKEKNEDEKSPGTVDQIKKKYGYSTGTELSVPAIAKDRLKDNSRKLQDTGTRSSEMQDTARSFSSMAKEFYRGPVSVYQHSHPLGLNPIHPK
ncbi:hypothetical protein MA16_Dca000425 [Dendrobium catenatum]|uniref:Lethal giant larvae (Lgl)-like C-terminal domain-containing protein n=1 Tax=Dendrobium catenatum TaxID=906689 RepID=A0A2I0WTV0_9ASPA|nr:hypothetical protein MA16_Dca000425 [Dendrobium catenatum]